MATGGGVRTYNPEYGSVRTLLLVGVLAVAGAVAAPAVAGAVGVPTVEVVVYGAVALVGVAAAGYEVRRQGDRNPHEFVATDVLVQFYDQHRPSPAGHLVHFVVAAVGATAVWLGHGPALARTEGALLVLERLGAGEPLPPIDPVNVGWGLVAAAGVLLFAVGVDRLLVGTYRELRYRLAAR